MAYVKNKTVIKRFWSYSVILVSILAVFSLPSVLFAQSNIAETVNNSQRQVSLTPEERSWLQAHPDIVLGFAEGIEPFGACRLCMVEISKNDRTRLVASCVYPVEDNLIVRTDSEKISKIRKTILELLWPSVQGMAKEYGITKSRFEVARIRNTSRGGPSLK